MKIPPAPHRWSVTPRRAAAIQRELAGRVRAVRPRRAIRLVAGLDSAFSADGRHCIGGAVVWDLVRQRVVERRIALREARFPYVPGLLSFREAPALLAALRALRTAPDALMCDGHGLAHPRRFGIACHLGVIVGLPTIGCAKSRLIGEYVEPGRRRGARSPLREGGERLGTVLRTREGVKPVFVSVGHRIDLATAERIVLDAATGYRLPEPTRLADRLVAARKRGATIAA
jgi:deoxyribonuclease V